MYICIYTYLQVYIAVKGLTVSLSLVYIDTADGIPAA